MSDKTAYNHALTEWNGPLGLPDFTAFKDDDFASAFDAALAADLAEVEAIAKATDKATIDNTLKALQLTGKALDRVSAVFWMRAGAHTNNTIQTLEREIAPKMSRHYSRIMMDPALFARIDALYENRDMLDLDTETKRVLEKTWKGFVRSGAKLDEAGKTELAGINEKLAGLGARFGQNVLKDESSWALFITDEADLTGLPDFLKNAMQSASAERGKPDSGRLRYHVRLSSHSFPSPKTVNCANRRSMPGQSAVRMGAKATIVKSCAKWWNCASAKPICSVTPTLQPTSSTTPWPRHLRQSWTCLSRSGTRRAPRPMKKRSNWSA